MTVISWRNVYIAKNNQKKNVFVIEHINLIKNVFVNKQIGDTDTKPCSCFKSLSNCDCNRVLQQQGNHFNRMRIGFGPEKCFPASVIRLLVRRVFVCGNSSRVLLLKVAWWFRGELFWTPMGICLSWFYDRSLKPYVALSVQRCLCLNQEVQTPWTAAVSSSCCLFSKAMLACPWICSWFVSQYISLAMSSYAPPRQTKVTPTRFPCLRLLFVFKVKSQRLWKG